MSGLYVALGGLYERQGNCSKPRPLPEGVAMQPEDALAANNLPTS